LKKPEWTIEVCSGDKYTWLIFGFVGCVGAPPIDVILECNIYGEMIVLKTVNNKTIESWIGYFDKRQFMDTKSSIPYFMESIMKNTRMKKYLYYSIDKFIYEFIKKNE
jgi:hypothetical protein